MRSTSGMRPISGSTLPAFAFSLRSTVNCFKALSPFCLPSAFSFFSSSAPFALCASGVAAPLPTPVADEADRVQPAHVLLLEEIDRIAFALAEQSDEHVAAGHLVAARRLDVEDRALDDALEAAGRRRIGRAIDLQRIEFGIEIMRDGALQLAEIDPARLHHLRRMFVVDQREQQMFERRIFVAPRAGRFERLVQRGFESAGKGWHQKFTPCGPRRMRGPFPTMSELCVPASSAGAQALVATADRQASAPAFIA